MNKLIGAFVCIGFLLVLCAAGASDCGTITLGQAIARAVTGTAMITAGILAYLHKEKRHLYGNTDDANAEGN